MLPFEFTFFKNIVLHIVHKGLTEDECVLDILDHEKGKLPEEETMRKWYREYVREMATPSVVVELQIGRPFLSDLGEEIRDLLLNHPNASTKYLAFLSGHHKATVKDRLLHELHMKKVVGRWVPYKLTPSMKALRVEAAKELKAFLMAQASTGFKYLITGDESWIPLTHPPGPHWIPVEEEPPELPKQGVGTEKQMLTVFWGVERMYGIYYLDQKKTMNSEEFKNTVLIPLRRSLSACGLTRKTTVFIHMDNAPAHRSKTTSAWLKGNGFSAVMHPARSPDLAPCDFYLFGWLKRQLRGCTFRNVDEMQRTVTGLLRSIDKSVLRSTFFNWIARCDKIVEKGGKYI
jgi:hypothetical protein